MAPRLGNRPVLAAAAVAAGLAVTALGATSASAAPAKGDPVVVVCDNGQTYLGTVIPGNSPFAPGITFAGGALVPKSFGPFTFTDFDDQGNVVGEPFVEPGRSHSSLEQGLTHCEFTVTGPDDDNGFHTEVTGTAEVIIAGSLR